MKKNLLTFTLLFGLAATMAADPTAKAIYCADNTTLYITYDEVTYTAGTAYENLDGKTVTKAYDIPSTGYNSFPKMTSALNDNFRYGRQNYNPISTDFGGENGELSTIIFLESCKDWRPTSLRSLFNDLQKLTTVIGGENLNTSEVTDMTALFENCRSLTNLQFLATWNTSKVTSLERTFSHCISLTDLNPLASEGWDVSKVKTMRHTFSNCSSLTDIKGLTNWVSSSVVNFMDTFCSCRALMDFSPLANWDVSSGIEMAYMFYYCLNLSDLTPFANWNVSNVEDMGYLFGRTNITEAKPLESWNTSKVKFMGEFFLQCENLESIEGLEQWDTQNLMSMTQMFSYCNSLLSLEPIYNWNSSKVYCMYRAFEECKSLTGNIDLSKWDLSALGVGQVEITITDPLYTQYWGGGGISYVFSNCSGITGVFFGKGNFGKEESINTINAFYGCPKLRFIDLSGMEDTYGNAVSATRSNTENMFYTVPRTTVIYLPSGNTEAETSDHENVVYTATDGLQCDKYYSEDAVDIELPHDFHADVATYERTFSSQHGGVILPYPVKINDDDDDEFQPYLLKKEIPNHMYFVGVAEVPANTPFAFLRKGSTDMKFEMSDVEVQNTYAISGETGDNIDPEFAWKTQGFYVNHEIEPVNGVFGIPTMDDYVANTYNTNSTSIVEYDYDRVYYIASDKFWQCKNAKLTIKPHRILFYGMWEKFDDSTSATSFDFTEYDGTNAITEADALPFESVTEIYDITGRQQQQMGRGLNVVRMSDGTVRKVIVK